MAKLIGDKPNQIPTNADLGDLAYQDGDKLATINVADNGLVVTEDGDVGIGVSSPDEKLDVDGNIRIQGTSPRVKFFESDNPTKTFECGLGGGNFLVVDDLAGTLPFVIQQGATENALFVTSTGKVGIGTSSPDGTTHIFSSSAGTVSAATDANDLVLENSINVGMSFLTANDSVARIKFGDPDATNAGVISYAHSDDSMRFNTDGSERMRIDSSGNVGIGTTNPSDKLDVNGSFSASSKNFVIDHPTRDGYKLRYGCLEGPENGVYVRGKTSSKTITLPDYWQNLVHEDSITVQLTPIGATASLYVIDYNNVEVNIGGDDVEYFYQIQGERKDIDKIVIEYEKPPVEEHQNTAVEEPEST